MKVRIRKVVFYGRTWVYGGDTSYTNYRVSVDGKYVDSFLTKTRAKRFVKEHYADVAKQDLVFERRI
jgi:hypothetical protein